MKIFINTISLIALVSLFLFTPFDGFRRLIILFVLFGVWAISSLIIDKKVLREILPQMLMLLFIMFLYLIYSHTSWGNAQLRLFFTHVLWTYIWGIIGIYYAANIGLFKKCLPFIVIMIGVSCVYTIIGNIAIPGASRLLAGAETEGSQLFSRIKSMHIGGYEFIYAMVFAVFPCTYWLKQLLSSTSLSILFLALLLATVMVGAYLTAIIMAFVALILTFASTKRLPVYLLVLAILFFTIYCFKDSIFQGLMDFGALIDSSTLQIRAQEVLEGTYQDDYDASGHYSRIERMGNALYNISQSPFWGRLFERSLDIRPSGHSELLGYFERFGIFGFLNLFFFYSIYKRIQKRVESIETKILLRVLYLFFLLFITINTVDTACSTGCMVFFVAPCTLLFVEKKKLSKQKQHINQACYQ